MELGYMFYPAPHPHALGHPQLDINLYDAPTGKHFDPHQATFPAFDPEAGIGPLTLEHPVSLKPTILTLGRIIISDLVGKEFEAFIFGGSLEAAHFATHSLCVVTSTAPIFDLRPIDPFEMELINEFETEIARSRAGWQQEQPSFDERLASIEPSQVFLALAASVQARLSSLSARAYSETYRHLNLALTNALLFLEPDGKLPPNPPTLTELMASG